LGIPYMDTQRNLICAKARESLTFQVTVSENFGLEPVSEFFLGLTDIRA
jgi:hypothetical protein